VPIPKRSASDIDAVVVDGLKALDPERLTFEAFSMLERSPTVGLQSDSITFFSFACTR
jgi:hypothetical protein